MDLDRTEALIMRKQDLNFLSTKLGLHHCIDVDIKGFFDNVNHSKLLKTNLVIGDKR